MDKIEVGKKLVAVKIDGNLTVDNSVFNTLSIADKGEATSALMKAGGDIKFVNDFKNFTNYRQIIKRLEVGEDVTTELAFNGVEADDTYLKAFKAYQDAVKPIIDKLKKLVPPYPLAAKPVGAESSIRLGSQSVQRQSYKMNLNAAKSVWERFSPYWASGNVGREPTSLYVQNGGGNYAELRHDDRNILKIRCQSFNRWEIEEMAAHYGWDFPEPK